MAELTIPKTITYAEAVELCGCSRSTIERAVDAGFIPAYKPGAEVQLVKAKVIEWYHSKRVTPRFPRTGRPRRTIKLNGQAR